MRPRKKQQRKEKQKQLANANSEFVTKFKTVPNSQSSENEMTSVDSKSMQTIASQGARYSGANLSSPESAYSTGYSTDGTSPGAPPEYYINIRTGTRYFPSEGGDKCAPTPTGNHLEAATRPLPPPPPTRNNLSPVIRPATANTNNALLQTSERPTVTVMGQDFDNKHLRNQNPTSTALPNRITEVVVVNSSLMSPRQRNRIRTNPWVPGTNLSPCNSSVGLHLKNDLTPRASLMNSPVPTRYLSPTVPCSPINRVARCASLSSSSCSSLSAASLNWDANLVRDDPPTVPSSALIAAAIRSPRFHTGSDEEDDCTLNEMMGKYDESYVYEKETDILSDSDPTDCETDIDTGQDGGDEDDPHETEFDFIDNGSFLEFNIKDERLNTGHCTYYNFEMQRKTSRKKTTRRSRKDSNKSERRRRSTSSKKRHKLPENKVNIAEGTRSAGATPVSVRRTKHPVSKLALDDTFRRRSNSVSIPRDPVNFFDKRDKEADKKYKELIVEAEHILKNMKSNVTGLSPRRVPGPANKRVELLRTENQPVLVKPPELKPRLNEDPIHPRIPSSFSPRFSPKRNHITKFINSNSPIMMRREEVTHSPVLFKKTPQDAHSPLMCRRQPKTDLPSRRSPKYRKKQIQKQNLSHFSSDSEENEDVGDVRDKFANECPQSEPVKRKIYSNQSKTVAFNLAHQNITTATHTEISMSIEETCRKSCESLRQQVLLNTISNLKRSLEDQSASLKQVYRSSQNLHT